MSNLIKRKYISLEKTYSVPGRAPEDVVIGEDGSVYTALIDEGEVLRIDPLNGEVTKIAYVGGSPLGVEIYPNGDLLICNAEIGLQRVNVKTGEVNVVLDSLFGVPMCLCNNATIARDGTIYFSETSQRFKLDNYVSDMIQGVGTGRLFKLSPSGVLEVLVGDLHFANGVALSVDEGFVLVAETSKRRILKYWLKGADKGKTEYLVEDMPAMPDNLSMSDDGILWTACPALKNEFLDKITKKPFWYRKIISNLPKFLHPEVKPCFAVMSFDLNSKESTLYEGDHREFSEATGVRVAGNHLYIGTIGHHAISVCNLAD